MLENGLSRAIGDFTVAAYVEIEAFCIFNLVEKMEQGVVAAAPVWSDAKTFPSRQFHRKVHGIIGGYPCQPFSLAGLRKGENDPRHLWPYLRHHIQHIRPKWCLFENVKDHLTLGFDTVYKELEAMGYAVEAGIFSAKECGAPHERQRLFILAVENSLRVRNGGRKHVQPVRECQVQTSRSGVMANASSQYRRLPICEPGQRGYAARNSVEAIRSGETMANTECNAPGRLPEREGTQYAGFASGSKNVPDTHRPDERKILPEAGEPIIRPEFVLDGNQWPAPIGIDQYEWEHPRTAESGMGCTIDGYNFREDILRMLGNGVVEQTAEIAFRNLMNKHGLNHLLNL